MPRVTDYPPLPGNLQDNDVLYVVRDSTDFQAAASKIGGGVSSDAGNALSAGTDGKPFLDEDDLGGEGGVSADANNALSLGSDDLPYLDADALGSGGGAVTSVNGATGAVTTQVAPQTDTLANFTSGNPATTTARFVIESDTGRVKAGLTGQNFSSLRYLEEAPTVVSVFGPTNITTVHNRNIVYGSSGQELTLQTNATAPMPSDSIVSAMNATFVAASGVTITRVPGEVAIKINTNEWIVSGGGSDGTALEEGDYIAGLVSDLDADAGGADTLSAWTALVAVADVPEQDATLPVVASYSTGDPEEAVRYSSLATLAWQVNEAVAGGSVSGTGALAFGFKPNINITLAGNFTLQVPSDAKDGQAGSILIDNTGDHTLSFGANTNAVTVDGGAFPTIPDSRFFLFYRVADEGGTLKLYYWWGGIPV